MSLLEERILEIIELREKGLEDKDIAKELGLEEKTIKLYEESTKKAINYLVLAGYKQEKIAKNIGLSLTAFNLFASYYNIKIPIPSKRIHRPRTQSIAEIKQAIAEGASSVEEISRKKGLAVSTIYKYAYESDIELFKHNRTQTKSINEIKQAIAEGTKSVQEVSKRTGLAPSTVCVYASQLGIKLPYYKVAVDYYKPKFKTKRDKLIRRGLSLGIISEKEKVTREAIRKYILKTEQYEKWKESRKYFKKRKKPEQLRKETFSQIASAIELIARQKLKEDEKWAYEKATEYFKLAKQSSYSFNTLFNLFKKYDEAKRAGKKLSLEELGGNANIHFVEVGRIIKKVNLEPFYGARKIKRITKEKKEVLDRANKINMSCLDIAYFLRINPSAIQAYYRKNFGIGRPKFKPLMKLLRGKGLTYKIASEIYEARDLRFSKKETIELFGITKKVYDYAIQHKKDIKPEIINALKILYPKKEINKPYINFK